MSIPVQLQVSFRAQGHQGIIELAKAFENKTTNLPAVLFLKSLSDGNGYSVGMEGDIVSWASRVPFSRPVDFAEALRPFWMSLLAEPNPDYPEPEDNIVIVYQVEDEAPGAIQIGLASQDSASPELRIQEFSDLPFSWEF